MTWLLTNLNPALKLQKRRHSTTVEYVIVALRYGRVYHILSWKSNLQEKKVCLSCKKRRYAWAVRERRASCMNISHKWRCVDFLYVMEVVSVWVQVFSQQIVSKVLSNFASIRSFKAYAPGPETICLYWPPTSHAEYFQTWTFSPPVHYARLSF